MTTKLIGIDLSIFDPQNLNSVEIQVNNHCTLQNAGGFKLISTFVFGTSLILVFQKP